MNLSVNYEELDTTGKKVLSQAEEFKNLLNNISNINENLKSQWQGQDSAKYANAVEAQAKIMKNLADTIESIGNYMIKVASAYKEVAENNASSINY